MSREPLSPSTPRHPLWRHLSCYQVGPKGAALSFEARLARENGWSAAHTARVLDEYRKFVFLAVTGDSEVTPSDAVDQVWHLHLTYTRDYWERFCPEILGRPLHHGPTAGGEEERGRFFRQYADTLKRYEAIFGPAPVDIWPSAQQRLIDDPRARRVHPRDGVIFLWKGLRQAMVAWLMVAAIALLLWWRM
ncbi:MAG: hypothetical protein C0476_01275 [Sphingomonas sp.]|nr:hypothetical protein [Sphingomonas sp.]